MDIQFDGSGPHFKKPLDRENFGELRNHPELEIASHVLNAVLRVRQFFPDKLSQAYPHAATALCLLLTHEQDTGRALWAMSEVAKLPKHVAEQGLTSTLENYRLETHEGSIKIQALLGLESAVGFEKASEIVRKLMPLNSDLTADDLMFLADAAQSSNHEERNVLKAVPKDIGATEERKVVAQPRVESLSDSQTLLKEADQAALAALNLLRPFVCHKLSVEEIKPEWLRGFCEHFKGDCAMLSLGLTFAAIQDDPEARGEVLRQAEKLSAHVKRLITPELQQAFG